MSLHTYMVMEDTVGLERERLCAHHSSFAGCPVGSIYFSKSGSQNQVEWK